MSVEFFSINLVKKLGRFNLEQSKQLMILNETNIIYSRQAQYKIPVTTPGSMQEGRFLNIERQWQVS